MKNNTHKDLSFPSLPLQGLTKKKKQEIELALVDIDSQLKQLAQAHLEGKISKTRHLMTIQEIRNKLFHAYNRCLHDLDIVEFAGSELLGSKVRLHSTEC